MESKVVEAAIGQAVAVIGSVLDSGNQAGFCKGGDAVGDGALGGELGNQRCGNDLVVL